MIEPSDYSVLDHLLEGCQIIDADRRYLYVNDTAARHGQHTIGELIGQRMVDLYPGVETTTMYTLLERCLEERLPATFENAFTYPNGTTAWFDIKMEPVPEGVFILSIDISARKHAETELHDQLDRLQALRAIDTAIISSTDLSITLRTILDQIIDSLQADAADLLLLNPFSLTLEYAAGRGFSGRDIERSSVRVGQGPAGRAALEQRPVIISDLHTTPEPFSRGISLEAEGIVAYIAAPLMSKGSLMGVLEVFHRAPLEPDPDWMDFLQALATQASIAIDNGRLYKDLQRSNMDLTLAYERTIEGWSNALDLRDRETKGHTQRVTDMTVTLARMMGLPESDIAHIRRGALLHDIGKMGVPDTILFKPGSLTEAEWAIMRRHPAYAYDLLYPIEYLRPCLTIPYSHHEKWDGTGYPQGLRGEHIPLAARLFAVVDVWDALCSNRPYRTAWSQTDVLDYIRQQSGSHFDPQIVDLFLRAVRERDA